MPFDATDAAISACHNRLPVFRKFLKSSACITLILVATGATALADGKYHNADGSRTDDLEAAAATWRNPEFLKDHALAGVKAEYAYAYGITGKGVKIGAVDSGVLTSHPQLAGKITSLTVQGTYGADGDRYEGANTGKWAWKKGDTFSVSGDYDPLINDSHGTAAAGEMVGLRDGKEMHGIAFDAHLYSVNTGGTDSTLTGPSVDYEYFKEAYAAASRNGARAVNSSWGQTPIIIGNYYTVGEMVQSYSHFLNKKTYADSVAEVSQQYGTIQIWANGNAGQNNPGTVVTLPYFRPEIEKYWVGVTGVNKDGHSEYDRCGVAKYWCIGGPTVDIYSTSVGRNGGDYDFGHGAPSDTISATYTPTYNGTSAAAPNVTASFALVAQRFPYLGNSQLRDVMFTTATHLTDARVKNDNADVPNETFGWGRPNMQSAMLGPAQFMDRFVVDLSKDAVVKGHANGTDIWSNDISDTALKARKAEEAKEVEDWKAKKQAKGWDKKFTTVEAQKEVGILRQELSSLLQSLETAIKKQDFASELDAVKKNPLASKVWSRVVASAQYGPYLELYGTNPRYKFVAAGVATDLGNFLKAADIVVAADITAAKETLLAEYNGTEVRTKYLTAKLADPTSYDGGLTKTGSGQLTLTGDSTYSGDTIVDGGELVIGREGSITSASIVNDTGLFTVEGIAAAATVNKGGRLNVAVGGTAGDTSVSGGWAAINGTSGATSVSE
ncbi:S8 family serine peptidase, partial [Phyllobacterium sp. YR531]|uniref:S8 family serine peptidase n=1 Tax=Phyllobacterium sp. YR531 TaxID=1144343 RepID=UPI00026F6413